MDTEYEISIGGVERNINTLKRLAGVPIWGVIKLDGYGAGLLFMAELLRRCGISRFAVSSVSELARLRRAGFCSEDVLILAPPSSDAEIESGLMHGGIFSVGSLNLALRLQCAARRLRTTARAHIKIDTGMGRFGFLPEEYPQVLELYRHPEALEIEGIYSHFSSAASDPGFTKLQYRRFCAILKHLEADGVHCGMAHISNSPALLRHPEMHLDAVRLGSALMGRVGGADAASCGLEKIGLLKTPIVEIKRVPASFHAGYGKRLPPRREVMAAILNVGRHAGLEPLGIKARYFSRLRPAASINGGRAAFLSSPGEGSALLDVSHICAHVGDMAELDLNPLRLSPDITRTYI